MKLQAERDAKRALEEAGERKRRRRITENQMRLPLQMRRSSMSQRQWLRFRLNPKKNSDDEGKRRCRR